MRRISYVHRTSARPLTGETIPGHLAGVVRRFPQRDAVVSLPQDTRLSYADLQAAVARLAKGLVTLGVDRGTRVGIWATDNVEWVLLQLATAQVGAVLVNVNPANQRPELAHALRAARVQALFLMPAFRTSHYADMLRAECPEADRCDPDALGCERLPDLRTVVVFDPDRKEPAARPARGFRTWAEVLAGGEGVPDAEVDRRTESLDCDDPVNIQFTSGTTGFPKPVVLTHHNILNNAIFTADVLGFTEADRLCVPVPFYHCFGMVVSNLVCLAVGAAIVIPASHFDAGSTLAAIQQERCTAVHGVPTMFVAELERADFARYDLSSLRTGIMAGAPCPPELMQRVITDMGCREILIAYGQTEASPITHLTRRDDTFERRVGTVGTNLPHQEVKIVSPETRAVVPVGERGEICLRGYHVMRGYFDMPEATHEAIDEEGWLHSGDLGVMDDDGYVRIVGRLKDMIIRGGENIYPAEIEAVLFAHPKVAQVAVFGVPHAKWGEEVAAWIQAHDGVTLEEDEIVSYARDRMARFKVPTRVRFVDAFPMTVTGKIQKHRMRDQELGARPEAPRASSEVAGGRPPR